MSQVISVNEAKGMALEAARHVLAEYKATQKRGRKDQGRGSKEIGDTILAHRRAKKLSISELAFNTGLHPTTIGKLESGQRGMGLKTFAVLAQILGEHFIDDVIHQVAKS